VAVLGTVPGFATFGARSPDASSLATSLVLLPLASVGIALRAPLHHRIDETIFVRVVYASLVVLGAKLVHDVIVGA